MGMKFTVNVEDIVGNDNVKNMLARFLPESIVSLVDGFLDGLEFKVSKPILNTEHKVVFECEEKKVYDALKGEHVTKTVFSVDVPPDILGAPKVGEFLDSVKDKLVEKLVSKIKKANE